MEMTITGCDPGWNRLTKCSYFDCGRYIPSGTALLCGRCRSVVFCSKQCQAAAWTGTRSVGRKQPDKEEAFATGSPP
eukprot:6522697-Prymnesium_polylepis.1